MLTIPWLLGFLVITILLLLARIVVLNGQVGPLKKEVEQGRMDRWGYNNLVEQACKADRSKQSLDQELKYLHNRVRRIELPEGQNEITITHHKGLDLSVQPVDSHAEAERVITETRFLGLRKFAVAIEIGVAETSEKPIPAEIFSALVRKAGYDLVDLAAKEAMQEHAELLRSKR